MKTLVSAAFVALALAAVPARAELRQSRRPED